MATQTALIFDAPLPRREREVRLNLTVPEPAKKRLGAQHERILERLRIGPATNADLVGIAQRFGGRIHELRNAGYQITQERVSEERGLFRYTLTEEAL